MPGAAAEQAQAAHKQRAGMSNWRCAFTKVQESGLGFPAMGHAVALVGQAIETCKQDSDGKRQPGAADGHNQARVPTLRLGFRTCDQRELQRVIACPSGDKSKLGQGRAPDARSEEMMRCVPLQAHSPGLASSGRFSANGTAKFHTKIASSPAGKGERRRFCGSRELLQSARFCSMHCTR